jgi:hypothetical protein
MLPYALRYSQFHPHRAFAKVASIATGASGESGRNATPSGNQTLRYKTAFLDGHILGVHLISGGLINEPENVRLEITRQTDRKIYKSNELLDNTASN